MAIASGGALGLTVAPGVARSLRLPDLAVGPRSPAARRLARRGRGPGQRRAAARPRTAGGRWCCRASGDLAAGLGPGPVALRADGRRVAALRDGAIEEIDLPGGEVAARHPAPAGLGALAYAADGRLLSAVGGGVGAPPAETGRRPRRRPRGRRRPRPGRWPGHADGTCSLWDTDSGARLGAWAAPGGDAGSLALSADGSAAALGAPDGGEAAAWLVRAADGAPVRRIEEARAIAPAPDAEHLLIGGDWGLMWLAPPTEDA